MNCALIQPLIIKSEEDNAVFKETAWEG